MASSAGAPAAAHNASAAITSGEGRRPGPRRIETSSGVSRRSPQTRLVAASGRAAAMVKPLRRTTRATCSPSTTSASLSSETSGHACLGSSTGMPPKKPSPIGKLFRHAPPVKAPCSRFTWSSWSQPVNARTGASALCSSAPSVRSVLLRRSEAMPARTRDVHSAAPAMTIRHTTARPTNTAARDISRRPAGAAGVWRELSSAWVLTGNPQDAVPIPRRE